MYINNETIGISAEVAIADFFNVPINDFYRDRANQDIAKSLVNVIKEAFNEIPQPTNHIAEGQNPVDFILIGNKTLSVKTNQQFSKKVAPQNVGQPTSSTYFHHFLEIYNNYVIPNDYASKCQLFKKVSIEKIDEVMAIYWNNLFHCDYLFHIYNIIDSYGNLTNNSQYIVYPYLTSKNFEKSKFSFTQAVNSWNESNTVKYYGITIGEFQVHNNRDCFKFRFNMDGVNQLLKNNLL